MKFKLCFLLIFLVANISICTYGQDKFGPGFYINMGGDTVVGIVRYQNNYTSSFDFKSGKKAKKQRLTFKEANQFGFLNGRRYNKLDFGLDDLIKDPAFAEVLFNGSIDLYKHQAYFFLDGSGKNKFRLAKNNGKDTEEAKKNYQMNIGYFNILFHDCPLFKMETPDAIIREENLVRLLKKYHTCKSETFQINTWPNNRTINVGFFLGSNSAQINYSGINDATYKFLERSKFSASTNPTYGITILVNSKNPYSVLSLQNELAYTRGNFESSSIYEYQAAGYEITESSQTSIKYAGVMYKVGPRISFRSNSINPYFAFGLALPIAGTSTGVSSRTVQINDTVTDTQELETPATISGLWVSAGLKKKVFDKHFVFVECIQDLKSGNGSAGSISALATKFGFLF